MRCSRSKRNILHQHTRSVGVIALALVSALTFVLCFTSVFAQDDSSKPVRGTLVIMTSFPPAFFEKYKAAFESAYPEVNLFVRNKKTSAAISFIEERPNETVDIFWASAPDAFDILKKSGHLLKLDEGAKGDVEQISHIPINDPSGYYKGFALSGYGIAWNPDYLQRVGLSIPRSWDDLKNPVYAGHIGISAPSRSGTTHLIVESILQQQGWDRGWATLMEIGGNLATITARSYGVLEGIKAERFGIGASIDFLGLSPKAMGESVEFAYADGTVLLPASIAIVKRTNNLPAARAFVDFVLSETAQKMLFDPEVSRLPILPHVYTQAPPYIHNPFTNSLVENTTAFDTELSRQRYHLVNVMFDTMITYRLPTLKRSWSAIHAAERALENSLRPDLAEKVGRARALMQQVPIDHIQANDANFTEGFVRPRPGMVVPTHQLDYEAAWAAFARERDEEALTIVSDVLKALNQKTESSP